MTEDIQRQLDEHLIRLAAGQPVPKEDAAAAELRELLAIAGTLRDRLIAIKPPSEAKAKVAAQFVAAVRKAATQDSSSARHWAQGLWLRARMALAAAAALVMLTGGTVYAATGAMPDSTFYPVKRAVEQIELLITRETAARADFGLRLAEKRLEEVRYLIRHGRRQGVSDLLTSAKSNVREATILMRSVRGAERARIAREISEFQRSEQVTLKSLRPQVDRTTRTIIDRHLNALPKRSVQPPSGPGSKPEVNQPSGNDNPTGRENAPATGRHKGISPSNRPGRAR